MAAHAMDRLRRQPDMTHHRDVHFDQAANRVRHRGSALELDRLGAALLD